MKRNGFQNLSPWFGVALFLVFVVSCAPPRAIQMRYDRERDLSSVPTSSPPGREEGSLWSSRAPVNLYADLKAGNPGDIVTISIVESARASKNATTKTARDSGLEASWSTGSVFDAIASAWSINGQKIGTSHKIDLANTFDGKGETTRTSYMDAYITARVMRVLPNGHLVIRGSREVRVNNEDQFIYIQGVIRPEDISSTNVVLSTYIAEAVIELSGEGAVSDKQRPGWLARMVDWAWPF
jgi:flagellar L-ring protein FlgH